MLKDSYQCFAVDIDDKVAHIRMTRGEQMNAMNRAFWNELPEIVRTIDRESLARVIVISSEGKHRGLLLLGKRLDRKKLSDADVHFIQSIAEQSAVALENVRLQKEMMEKKRMEKEKVKRI